MSYAPADGRPGFFYLAELNRQSMLTIFKSTGQLAACISGRFASQCPFATCREWKIAM